VDLASSPGDLSIVREMSGPYGIPDFTAIVGGRDTIDARLACPVPPLLNEIDAAIVAVAHVNAARRVDALARAVGWPVATIARRVPHLVRSGGLIEVRPKLYVRPQAIQPHGSIVAVEAKVEDWRKALRQVRTYAVWADSYVVVMGGLTKKATQVMREEVLRDSGGLVVDGEWVVRPSLVSPNSRQRRLWAAEHVIAALRDSHQPSSAP
jgi:DNA-binding Lrp family transcriptional regulator